MCKRICFPFIGEVILQGNLLIGMTADKDLAVSCKTEVGGAAISFCFLLFCFTTDGLERAD